MRPVSVQTGISNGERVEIRSGLKPGQRVVTLGHQYLSEGDSVTAPQNTLASVPAADDMSGMKNTDGMKETGAAKNGDVKTQSAAIAVTDKGFEPASVTLQAGVPARVTFTRKTEATCATDVVFPEFSIKKSAFESASDR